MKIAVKRIFPTGDTFDKETRERFYDELWQEYLLSRLTENDDVEWIKHMPATKEEFDECLSDCDAVVGVSLENGMLTGETIKKHPNLKYIGVASHGYGDFDKAACREHGVTVTNSIHNTHSVAQHTMALLLEICNNVGIHNYFYKNIKWTGVSELRTRQIELYGKTIGLIGYGNIGKQVAVMSKGFGMNVLAYARSLTPGTENNGVSFVTLDELYAQSDIISIHCPLTTETRNMLNEETIARLKHGVIILNTARGGIIDETALLNAVNSGQVYAAGLDTLCGEPLSEPSKLFSNPNIIITEHIAWMSIESKTRLVQVLCENFFNWREGKPTSVIS